MGRKTKLQNDPNLLSGIVSSLELGKTVAMACAENHISQETYFQYVKRYAEFAEAVTRAQQTALGKAVVAFRSGLEGQKANEVQIDEFTETRLNKRGEPYTYVKKTTRKKVVETPPDWRAGEAYLKRRDPKNWSERIDVQFNISLELIFKLATAIEATGVNPSDFFEEMLQELALADRTSNPK